MNFHKLLTFQVSCPLDTFLNKNTSDSYSFSSCSQRVDKINIFFQLWSVLINQKKKFKFNKMNLNIFFIICSVLLITVRYARGGYQYNDMIREILDAKISGQPLTPAQEAFKVSFITIYFLLWCQLKRFLPFRFHSHEPDADERDFQCAYCELKFRESVRVQLVWDSPQVK